MGVAQWQGQGSGSGRAGQGCGMHRLHGTHLNSSGGSPYDNDARLMVCQTIIGMDDAGDNDARLMVCEVITGIDGVGNNDAHLMVCQVIRGMDGAGDPSQLQSTCTQRYCCSHFARWRLGFWFVSYGCRSQLWRQWC